VDREIPSNPLDPIVAAQDNRTLDRALRFTPDAISPADWPLIVEALRRDRARFIHAQQTKQEAKE
jgi:hypothetical protein